MHNKVLYMISCTVCWQVTVETETPKKFECGYKQCPPTRDGALNVHLIPHSHMDAGWVKTFDEYYYGTRTSVSSANVQLIYHSVLSELLHDKRRRFTLSETGYFWRWWKEQRPLTRSTFRSLVREGRLEFAGGGWVQNDEATLDYQTIIDQFTWGLRKINDTLGPCGKPKSAWQIDSYGHSREQASMMAQMGYDGLFIGRVDHKEREAMMEEDRMEFIWRGSDVLGKMSDIMTHTLFNLYNAPEGFCFDFLCTDEPIMDDQDSRAYNAGKRVGEFIAQIEKQAKYYDHDNILVTMGGDFTYQSAANWFMNMDKLINHVNTHSANISDINVFYSTPSCYLKALYLYGRRDKGMHTEKGDHFPYGSDASTYWTGFYTSRPSLKYLIRQSNAFIQVIKQLTVTSHTTDTYELHLLRHAVGLMTHHDTITGTSQQHVVNDFTTLLTEAMDACARKVSYLMSLLTPTWGNSRRTNKNGYHFTVCFQLNVSQCKISDNQDSLVVIVYNPSSIKTYHYVRLPATAFQYSIRDANDEEIEHQLVPMVAAAINLPGRRTTAIQDMYFEAENIPPLGFSAYHITPVHDILKESDFPRKKSTSETSEQLNVIHNEYLKVTVNKDTGLLESVHHMDGVTVSVTQMFHYYAQSQQQTLQSGAYSFRPITCTPISVKDKVVYQTNQGALVSEIQQRFTDWLTQVIRLYRGEDFVEFEWIVGPIPVGSDVGKEVVTRFTTNITNVGDFHTDSNGRQMMKRSCFTKPGNKGQKKTLPSCYYPITSRICIQAANSSEEMCILVDRAQGGTSYNEGEIELMIHRRLLTDDGFGLEESLNEEAFGVGLVVKGKHRMILGNRKQEVDELTFSERMSVASRRWMQEPWLFLSSAEKMNRRKWQNIRNKKFSAFRPRGVPRHINILTLEPWKAGSVLLRLENTLEHEKLRSRYKSAKPDGTEEYVEAKSSRISVDIRKIFMHQRVREVRETTLAANQWLDEARQMDWSTRYVYNGGDDDVLPEDNIDYGDDNKPYTLKHGVKEPTYDSNEDYDEKTVRTHVDERKMKKQGKKRIRYQEDEYSDRRKRSTDEVFASQNGTRVQDSTNKEHAKKKEDQRTDIKEAFNAGNDEFRSLNKNIQGHNRNGTRSSNKSSINARKSKYNKPNRRGKSFQFDSEYDRKCRENDCQEYSEMVRRKQRARSFENREIRHPELENDEEDEITKSIYEMYYKRKPRRRFDTETAAAGDSEEKKKEEGENKGASTRENNERRRSFKHARDGVGGTVRVKKRKPMMTTHVKAQEVREPKEDLSRDTAAYIVDGNLRRSYDDEEDGATEKSFRHVDDFEEEDNPDDISYTKMRYRRSTNRESGRDHSQPDERRSETDTQEDEYVITLRPTQIRTFVVWFEAPKKAYSM